MGIGWVVLISLGLVVAIGLMCFGVWLAWRRPKLEEPLPDGTYRIKCVGHDKLSGTPLYEAEVVEDSEEVK